MNNKMFYEMIFKRKSFHLFKDTGDIKISDDELKDIEDFCLKLKPLNKEIKTKIRILNNNETTCKRGQEYLILLYSENKDNYLQNIGYIGEQIDLYLVSKNIGTLWFGIGKVKEKQYDGLEFVIMIAIKKVDDPSKFRKDMFKSKRKNLDEIWSGEIIDNVSDIVRFAPSACNTQPWYVENKDNKLSIYRYKKAGKRGIMPILKVSEYNKIDIGIFMCFLDICLNKQNIKYEKTIFNDIEINDELYLNAEYRLIK